MEIFTLTETAKLLEVNRNNLFRLLRQNKIINKKNLAYQRFVQKGYFSVQHREWLNKNVDIKNQYGITLVTSTGVFYISDLIEENEQCH